MGLMLRRALLALLLSACLVAGFAQSAGAVEYWRVTGTVIDADTGEPALGVHYAVYAWDPLLDELVLASDGLVASGGRIITSVPDNRPWAIVFVGGSNRYYEEWHRDIRVEKSILDRYSHIAPSSMAMDANAAKAKRLYRDMDGASFGNIYLETLPQPHGAIAGRITERYSGNPYPRGWIFVWLYNAATGRWEPELGTEDIRQDGSFFIRGRETGSLTGDFKIQYQVGEKDSWFPSGSRIEDAATLRLQPGEVLTGMDGDVAVPTRLSGTIMRTESKRPLDNTIVDAYKYDSVSRRWEQYTSEGGKENGTYWLRESGRLEPGIYKLNVFDRWRIYDPLHYGQTRTLSAARQVTLSDGDVKTGLDIWMSNRSALAGTIRESGGAAKPDVLMTAFRKLSNGSWDYAGKDYTDSHGRYRIFVEPGTYTLRITDKAGSEERGDDVYVYLGGSTSVDAAVQVTVREGMARVVNPSSPETLVDPEADRVFGMSVYSSAIAASKSEFASGESTQAVIAPAGRYAEGMAAAGLAGAVDGPVLFTGTKKMSRSTLVELRRLGTEKVYIVGNSDMISTGQSRIFRAMGISVERVTGRTRYDIAANVARTIERIAPGSAQRPVFVVSGRSQTNGLFVGPVAYRQKSPVLFVDPNTATPASVVSAAKDLGYTKVYAVGEGTSVPWSSLKGIATAGVSVSRIATSTSAYTRAASFATAAERRGWVTAQRAGLISSASLENGVACSAALGRSQGILLFATRTSLPWSTTSAIRSRSARIDRVRAYARPEVLGSGVLLKAGSL